MNNWYLTEIEDKYNLVSAWQKNKCFLMFLNPERAIFLTNWVQSYIQQIEATFAFLMMIMFLLEVLLHQGAEDFQCHYYDNL